MRALTRWQIEYDGPTPPEALWRHLNEVSRDVKPGAGTRLREGNASFDAAVRRRRVIA